MMFPMGVIKPEGTRNGSKTSRPVLLVFGTVLELTCELKKSANKPPFEMLSQ